MAGKMVLRIWDVEHGACAMLHHSLNDVAGRLAMIDSGDASDWRPSTFIRRDLHRTRLDYLFVWDNGWQLDVGAAYLCQVGRANACEGGTAPGTS